MKTLKQLEALHDQESYLLRHHQSAKISIDFAIEVLEDLKIEMNNTTRGWSKIKLENKIEQLKNLI